MQENVSKIQLKNFTSLRNWEVDSEIPNNCLFESVNCEFDGGIWKSIKGTTSYLPNLAGGSVVNGLFHYPYTLSDKTEKDYLLEYYNKAFYLIDTESDTRTVVPATTFTVDEELSSVPYNNDIYVISVTNGLGYIKDGGTWGSDFTVKSAFVTGGKEAIANVALWNAILTGSFRITIDGVSRDVTGIDFSSTTIADMATVAGHIQLALRTVTGGMETVEWETDHFIITSGAIPSLSSITVTSSNGIGTDISGAGAFTGLATSTGFGVVTNVSVLPVGSMVETAFEKMWIAGDPLNQNLITYSRTASAANPEYIRDYTNGSGRALVGSGGIITAIKKLKNTMYVFKQDSIFYLSGFNTSGTYPIPIFTPFAVTGGAINQKSVVQVENDLWFLNQNLQIRSLGSEAQYISDTARTNDVSLAIKRFLEELDPKQPRAVMSYFKNVLKISLRTNGSEYNNWVLTYDFNNGGYSVERLHPVKMYAATGSQRFFCEDGAVSSSLFKDNVGYSKNGSAFYFTGKTKMVNFGKATQSGRLRYIRIYCGRSQGQALDLNVYVDNYSNPSSSSKILIAPTATELGIATTTGGGFGEEGFGEDMYGGSGNLNTNEVLDVYRKVFVVDQNLTGRMFGIEIGGTINGSRAEIYEIELGIIPMTDKFTYVTN